MKRIPVNVFDAGTKQFHSQWMEIDESDGISLSDGQAGNSQIYVSPGFIDSHVHVYHGATDLGVPADRVGLNTGVHLVIDAGSAGSNTIICFRDYVVPAYDTEVKAFLNISRVGLVTKQPYYDTRNIDLQAAKDCFKEDRKGFLLGIKVLSSGLIVENQGILPMRKAVEAAEIIGCRVMAHLVEGPPSNEDTMALLRKGDIITHCFHGAPNIKASLKATKASSVNMEYCSLANIMWNEDGTPTKPLEQALNRGVLLDVGHGAASLDQFVARAAIRAGVREFSISSDAHIRNIETIVKGLPETMSKFLSFGMTLNEVVASVTSIPAKQLGLDHWCDDLTQRATIFRIRPVSEADLPFMDANHIPIEVNELIEPLGVVRGGKLSDIVKGWRNSISS